MNARNFTAKFYDMDIGKYITQTITVFCGYGESHPEAWYWTEAINHALRNERILCKLHETENIFFDGIEVKG